MVIAREQAVRPWQLLRFRRTGLLWPTKDTQRLAESFSPDVKEAWVETYTRVADVVKQGGGDGLEKDAAQPSLWQMISGMKQAS